MTSSPRLPGYRGGKIAALCSLSRSPSRCARNPRYRRTAGTQQSGHLGGAGAGTDISSEHSLQHRRLGGAAQRGRVGARCTTGAGGAAGLPPSGDGRGEARAGLRKALFLQRPVGTRCEVGAVAGRHRAALLQKVREHVDLTAGALGSSTEIEVTGLHEPLILRPAGERGVEVSLPLKVTYRRKA